MISYSLDLAEKLEPPTTVPDEVVSIVLNISFNIQPENLERIKEEHRFSMAAENIVGDLLERFVRYQPPRHLQRFLMRWLA